MGNAQTTSTCLWPYAIVDGARKHISEVARYTHGICPLCGAELVSKKGESNAHHWAHSGEQKCDSWYQPKGPWHLAWQGIAPDAWREVVIERNGVKHIADIKTPSDVIVEVQWSSISPEDIRVREEFYCEMIWIVGNSKQLQNKFLFGGFKYKGRRIFSLDSGRSNKWLNSRRPVFIEMMDDQYLAVLPQCRNEYAQVVFEISRYEIECAIANDDIRDFLNRIAEAPLEVFRKQVDVGVNRVIYALKIDRENKERAKRLREYQEWEKTKIQDKWIPKGKMYSIPNLVLTLGWVEAHLICFGLLDRIKANGLNTNLLGESGYRLYIHVANAYSETQYKVDIAKARKYCKQDLAWYTYDHLGTAKDTIIGYVEYNIRKEDNREVLTFNNSVALKGSTFKLYDRERGVSTITDKQASFLYSISSHYFDLI